jgi:hypothetical protein
MRFAQNLRGPRRPRPSRTASLRRRQSGAQRLGISGNWRFYVDYIAVRVVKGRGPLIPHYSRQTADTAVASVKALVPTEDITRAILVLRAHRVLLDSELAALYGVTTKRLNEQVKRNTKRFPADFIFRLTRTETEALNRSQNATGSQKHRDPRFPPYVFTEHGAIMAAMVLNSPRAAQNW